MFSAQNPSCTARGGAYAQTAQCDVGIAARSVTCTRPSMGRVLLLWFCKEIAVLPTVTKQPRYELIPSKISKGDIRAGCGGARSAGPPLTMRNADCARQAGQWINLADCPGGIILWWSDTSLPERTDRSIAQAVLWMGIGMTCVYLDQLVSVLQSVSQPSIRSCSV